MSAVAGSTSLERARASTLASARVLRLLRFKKAAHLPCFGPSISTYHEMFNPAAKDECKLRACQAYLEAVRHATIHESFLVKSEAQSQYWDPYGLELHTTFRGTLLQLAHEHLCQAIASFEAMGIQA